MIIFFYSVEGGGVKVDLDDVLDYYRFDNERLTIDYTKDPAEFAAAMADASNLKLPPKRALSILHGAGYEIRSVKGYFDDPESKDPNARKAASYGMARYLFVTRNGDSMRQIHCVDYCQCVYVSAIDALYYRATRSKTPNAIRLPGDVLPPMPTLWQLGPSLARSLVSAAMRRHGVHNRIIETFKFLPGPECMSLVRIAIFDAMPGRDHSVIDPTNKEAARILEDAFIAASCRRLEGIGTNPDDDLYLYNHFGK